MKAKLVKESLNEFVGVHPWIGKIETFMEVLDFPRQNPEGYLEKIGDISIENDIIGTQYEEGFKILSENPEVLNSPVVQSMLDRWQIQEIDVDGDDINIIYSPMSQEDYENQDWEANDGISYEEYLERMTDSSPGGGARFDGPMAEDKYKGIRFDPR